MDVVDCNKLFFSPRLLFSFPANRDSALEGRSVFCLPDFWLGWDGISVGSTPDQKLANKRKDTHRKSEGN